MTQPRGIIPALAGNTVPAGVSDSRWWDHPRSRGEYRDIDRPSDDAGGSSPLSRGILKEIFENQNELRIIPALAGNTIHGRSTPSDRPDHPRSRGEYHTWSLVI